MANLKSIITDVFKVICLCFCSLVASLIMNSPVFAEQPFSKSYSIAGQPVILSLPKGYCAMDEKNPSDKRLIDAVKLSVKGANEVLMQFADCQELQDWRSGKQRFLNNFGSYQTSLRFKNMNMKGREAVTVKEICNVFKKQSQALVDKIKPDIDNRIENAFENVKMNEMKLLGVSHEDSTVCITATFQRLQTEKKTSKDQMNISAVNVLNGRLMFTYLYTPYKGEKVIEKNTKTMVNLNNVNQLNNNQKQ